MFIKTQDRQTLINLRNIVRIQAEAYKLYAYLTGEDAYGDTWVKIVEFQDKDRATNELNNIQKWIEKSTKKVYEVTID